METVKQFVKSNSGCELISDSFVSVHKKLTFKCGCGNVFTTTFKEFTRRETEKYKPKRQCNECGKKRGADTRRKPMDVFVDEVRSLVGEEYTVVGAYEAALIKIKIRHNVCNHIFDMPPNDFLKGNRCPSCFGAKKKTIEEYKKEVFDLVGFEYDVLGSTYNGNKTKIPMLHKKCGNTWNVSPNSFLRGTRCPKCYSSRGENKIRDVLNELGVEFKEQVKFDDCRNTLPLPFDFAVYERDRVKLLIEYDGVQHFEPIEHFGGRKRFLERMENDKIKEEYCNKNHVDLLRIPYTKFNEIDNIIHNIVKNAYN